MKKAATVLYHGKEFASAGSGRFVKDVLHVGTWIHPATNQVVDITPERLRNLALNTERYRQNVDKKALPFPDGHKMSSMANLGDWPGPFVVYGDALYGVVEPKGQDVVERLESKKIRSVSARIDFDVQDSKGNKYDEVITHVCATPYPVLDGQGDFIKLSREEEESLLLVPKDLAGMSPEGDRSEGKSMLKNIALALGLAEAATEAEVLGALKKQGDDLKGLKDGQTALAAVLEKEHKLKLDGGKVVKLAQDPPAGGTGGLDLAIKDSDSEQVKLLKRLAAQGQTDIASLKGQTALSAIGNAKATAEQLAKDGILPPALKDTVAELLSIQGEVQGLSLSADGKAIEKGIPLANRLLDVLKGMPKITDLRLSQDAGQGDEDKKAAEASDKKVDEVVKRLQPETSTK